MDSQGATLINLLLLVSSVLLWVVVLLLGFLLLGALRAIGLLAWRLEQLEATTPSRIGRSGLKPGKKAPAFTLPSVAGAEVALSDYAGRKVLLVFVQTGCSPCGAIVAELNRLDGGGELQVLAINSAAPEAARAWAGLVRAAFPVLVQERLSVSKRYEVLATPFAFLIDEQGVIASKGIINNKQHIGFVLERRRDGAKAEHSEAETSEADAEEPKDPYAVSLSKEVGHD